MERERFACRVYKIMETGTNTINISIEATDTRHKAEIIRKLKKIGLYVTPTRSNKKLVDLRITTLNDDYITADMLTDGKNKD